MASIVKIPKDNTADYDFIAFSFDGLHSYEDFGLYRTSDGDRYNENLAPQMTERTADNPERDGQYYFGTQHKQRVFDIKFAFDSLTEAKLSGLKKWLNGKKVADLWFAEAPYKVYSAKVTGTPNIKALCFDEQYNDNGTTKTRRVYRGEGSVQFTCYYPYAHTPDKIQGWNGIDWVDVGVGSTHTSYINFQNYNSIKEALPGYGESDPSYGDLPFHFVARLQAPGSTTNINISVATVNDEISATYDITAPNTNISDGQEYIIGG